MKIVKIIKESQRVPVYDISVDDQHHFELANGVIAHNCFYAGSDALMTYALATKTVCYYQEAKLSGQIDNMVLYPLMKYEEETTLIDYEYLNRVKEQCNDRIRVLVSEIYQDVGYVFELNSNKQLADALQSLGLNTGKYTKTGLMQTGIEELERIADQHVVCKKIVEYKQLFKMVSSYVDTIYTYAREAGGRLRFNYKTNAVPCLTEDNYVIIKGKGLISIKLVEVGDSIWTQYGWKKVLWNNKKWSNKVYKIKLKNGLVMTGTGHHPVLVNLSGRNDKIRLEWSGLTSLSKGEKVFLNHKCVQDDICRNIVTGKQIGRAHV